MSEKQKISTTKNPYKDFPLITIDEYNEFVDAINKTILHRQSPDAFMFAEFMKGWLEANPSYAQQFPERWAELEYLLIAVRWIALPLLPLPDVLNMFQHHMDTLFTMQTTLELPEDKLVTKETFRELMRTRLETIYDIDERDNFKKELIKSILQGEAVITSEQFFDGIREVKPTLGMWANQYEAYAMKRYYNSVIDGFLRNNENARRLPKVAKASLRELFQLFNHLHVSSYAPEGLETPLYIDRADAPPAVMEYGEITEYPKNYKEQFVERMKAIKQLYEESGIELPSSMDWLDSKVQERPPVQLPTKGALSEIGGGPAVDTLEGPDHFTEQDALDIQQHTALIDDLVTQSVDYDAQAQQLITRMELVFASADVEQAVKQLIVSVLRGLRDTMELRTYLEQHNFEATQIDQVIAVLKATLYKRAEAVAETSSVVPAAPTTPTPVEAGISGADQSQRSTSPSATEEAKHSFLPKLRRARVAKKPIIDDVKLQQSMVMGPIDELRAMDVLEFRRLSDNPAAAAQKIKTKIDLLAEESISKQAEGVEAWRASIINGIYVAIGNESISTGKSVAEVIADWKASGKSVITEDEFSAIADINQQLRF